MRKKSLFIGMLGILVIVAVLGAFFQTGEDLFQKALRLERNEGKLMEAVTLYEKVVVESEDKSLSAKAQLRIGLCYEKLGQKKVEQAQQAFEKVITNYPNETETVQLARQKLSRLVQAKSVLQKGDEGLKFVKIEADRLIGENAEISPDGRYISFVDWDTGDLAIQDLTTGEKRRLTNKGPWKKSGDFALHSKWSPDGKQIAFNWFYAKKPGYFGIRVVEPDGSNLRDLDIIKGPNEDASQICDWSPDGTQILGLKWLEDETKWLEDENDNLKKQIVLISVKDGSVRTLKTLDSGKPTDIYNLRFSPGGRYIVYDFIEKEGSSQHDIFLISADGKKEIQLVEHPADDYFYGFLPDGKHILFSSNRKGTWDLWTLSVDEEGKSGVPELVKSNVGYIVPLGITQKGTLCYIHLKTMRDIYHVEFDPEKGEITTPLNKTVKYYEGMNNSPDYSPDGKYLAYVSKRDVRAWRRTPLSVGNVLCIYSFEEDKNREIATKLNVYGFPCWSPDGRFILIQGAYDDESLGIYTIDVQSGEAKSVVIDKTIQRSCEWSLDGKSVFYVLGGRGDGFCEIRTKYLETGEEKLLYREDKDKRFSISLSRDGKWLAILSNKPQQRELRILPVSGGEPKEIFTFVQNTGHYLSHVWSMDGKFIYLPKFTPDWPIDFDKKEEHMWSLWSIPVEGGEPKEIELGVWLMFNLTMHPDGKHIAFASWGFPDFSKMGPTEVWMMENILPSDKN
jgi:Tol biopolymer transport system component